MKTGENREKELNKVEMNFSPTCRQKLQRQCSTTIYCQRNSIFHRQKKKVILFIYLTGQNRGLSGLKNIWRPAVRYFEPCNFFVIHTYIYYVPALIKLIIISGITD